MQLTEEIKKYIDKCLVCWLATASDDGIPNVSPKECFTHFGSAGIIVANIASPQTVRNIQQNEEVCVSFIEVFVQKGFQIKGKATIVGKTHAEFSEMECILNEMTGGKFPFKTITKITVEQVKPIIAPSYLLYPETTEKDQIESAKRSYVVQRNSVNSE
ncbi:MAG: pyridoxamine 5'-phosphate oxidase family protein [Saprospiraceae bacterium]|nr:pyridoxamine 5'-phosphate oxidase family protein [Saprospiraceae bacterium]